MRKLWDFHGGIHPPENKQQSNQVAIRKVSLPKTLILPLSQHMGHAADPIVKVGQTVSKGELIAEAVGRISVPLHAPTSGTIVAIEDHPVPHPSGMTDKCVILEADGRDHWTTLEPCENYKNLAPQEILARVRQAGIAGLGGAGFPTEVKLHPPSSDKVNSLILNGAECEPYITADDLLMRERATEIVKGMEIMAYVLEPEEALIGIEDNKPEAIAAMRSATANTHIEIIAVPTKYPSGGERQLIKILTGREVPHGHIPADIGVMCQNVATAAAVYRAIRFGEPLISRITTITGEAVSDCGNYEVLIGTPMSHLLSQAGLNTDDGLTDHAEGIPANNPTGKQARRQARNQAPSQIRRLIMGGPMMGFTLPDVDLPIIKTSNCLLAATAREFPDPDPEQPCIRCSWCAEVCPAELLPQQLYWYAKTEEFDKTEINNLFDCIECGACSYVCPSSIPLVQYYRFAKHRIRANRIEQQKSDQARERFEFRKLRLEREQQEKAAKRRARAEAAAKTQTTKQHAGDAASATTSAASKQAEIAAAVQRSLAKRQQSAMAGAPSEQPVQSPNLEELQANVDRAKAKLAKVKTNLSEAELSQNPMAEKLRNAFEKNQQRLIAAETALTQAKQTHQQTGGTTSNVNITVSVAEETTPDFAALRNNILKAEEKLQMMQGMLADAQRQGDEAKTAKFKRAVNKNQERLAAARQALEDATVVSP